MSVRRIQMKPDAAPEPIIDSYGNNLGTFMPGMGYWVTTQNAVCVERVLADGRAIEVDPSKAPLPPGIVLDVNSGRLSGSVKVG